MNVKNVLKVHVYLMFKMKIIISLGGSRIVPNKVDYEFLKKFKKIINKIKKGNKIVIVTGGGNLAREYINALKKEGLNDRILSLIGIKTTKLNAMLVSNFLRANVLIPDSLSEVKKLLKKNIFVCGAVGFHPKMTSDGAAADIARHMCADVFVNITNVKGLYDKDPKLKNAKFIPEISFNDFNKIVDKIKFKPGQHFVLDQSAAKIICRNKIKTIITDDINNLVKVVESKKFIGTVIS
jgi:uridylate kinase